MGTYVGSAEAARILGVRPATLYAYVSRGLLPRRTGPDGRRSLYALDDVEALARRGRSRTAPPPPSIDVRVTSAVTVLDEDGPRYRGHPVVDLVDAGYERVAELLWTGALPDDPVIWPAPTTEDGRVADAVVDAVGRPGLAALTAAAAALADRHPADSPPDAARRLLALTPTLVADEHRPSPAADDAARRVLRTASSTAADRPEADVAGRLARAWTGEVDPTTVQALDRALVLLADHELTTSTLAARVAASVRPAAGHALAAGVAAMAGDLHGGAPAQVARLLVEVRADGAEAAVARRRDRGERVAGFGHSVYRRRDPRLAPLLAAVAALPDPDGWAPVVADLLDVGGARLPVAPNVDLGLGALLLTAGLPADTPLFAVARLAGLAAHIAEELEARPVRYRGLARPPG